MRKEDVMTNVVTNVKDIMEIEEFDDLNPKYELMINFLKLKNIAKKHKEQIEKYIETNREIRNGQTVLKGTRITTKELFLILSENDDKQDVIDYILKQYPSIDCKEKIVYGILYEINKQNTLIYTMRILFSK